MNTDFDKKFAALKEKYCSELPEKAEEINKTWSQLTHLSWKREWLVKLQQQVHQLAGSGGAFGFRDLSLCAREIDVCLQEVIESQGIKTIDHMPFTVMVEKLKKHLEEVIDQHNQSGIDKNTVNEENAKDSPLVYVVDDDQTLLSLIELQLESDNYRVKTYLSTSACLAAIAQQQPDIILMDICFPTGSLAGIEAIGLIKNEVSKKVPVIFMSSRIDMIAKVRALRAGGAAYLAKPFTTSELLSTVSEVLDMAKAIKQRILLIDDDREVSKKYQLLFETNGYDARIVTNPLHSLHKISEYKPDAILVDMHMPNVNGLEVLQIIRQTPEIALTPVIFLTSDDSAKTRSSAFDAGANAYINKNVTDKDLIACIQETVTSNLKNIRLFSQLTQNQSSNGMLNRQYFLNCLEASFGSKRAASQSHALYYFSIDQLDKIHRSHGLTGRIKLQEQLLDSMSSIISLDDKWSAISDSAITILSPHKTIQQHQMHAKHIIDQIDKTEFMIDAISAKCTASIGIVILDENIRSAETAIASAEKAFQKSFLDGGNRVSIHKTSTTQQLDFLFNEELPEDLLELCYQPILDIEGNVSSVYDSFIRLSTPEGEKIPAVSFIHKVHRNGLSKSLDLWILNQALNFLSRKNFSGSAKKVCLHLSNSTMIKAENVNEISSMINCSDLHPENQIIFHIDESWLEPHLEAGQAFSKAMQKENCGILLYNYGTTSSSEKLLANGNYDYVQLAPILVTGMMADVAKKSRIISLINHANQHQSIVVASHIVNPQGLYLLFELGARLFHGHFLENQ